MEKQFGEGEEETDRLKSGKKRRIKAVLRKQAKTTSKPRSHRFAPCAVAETQGMRRGGGGDRGEMSAGNAEVVCFDGVMGDAEEMRGPTRGTA